MDIFGEKFSGSVKKRVESPGANYELTFDGQALSESDNAQKGIFRTQQYDWNLRYSSSSKSQFCVTADHIETHAQLDKYQLVWVKNYEKQVNAEQAIYRFEFDEAVEINTGQLNIQVPHQVTIRAPKCVENYQTVHQVSQQIELKAKQVLFQAEQVKSQFQTQQIEADQLKMPSQHRVILPPLSGAVGNISLLSFKHPLFDFEQIKPFIPQLPSYGLKALLNQYPKDQAQWVYEQLMAHVQRRYPETNQSLNQVDLKQMPWPTDAIERQLLQLRVNALSWF